jgi:hypothetical protein
MVCLAFSQAGKQAERRRDFEEIKRFGRPSDRPNLLTHRVFHRLSADQVDVQVWDGLSAVRASVRDHAIAALGDALLRGELTRHTEEMSHELLIFHFQRIDRFDMFVWYDQDMSRRNGINVAKGCCLIVLMDDDCFGFIIHDLTKDAISHFIYVANDGLD